MGEEIFKTPKGTRVRIIDKHDKLPVSMPNGEILVRKVKDGHYFYIKRLDLLSMDIYEELT